MSLTSWITGRTRGVEEFAEIIKSVTPSKDDFRTISGNKPSEYKMYVSYGLTNHNHASYVGTAFDYLARFRIARILKDEKATKSLVAEKGFLSLMNISKDKKVNLKPEHYDNMLKPVLDYINGNSDNTIEELIPVAIRLAYLESIARGNLDLEQVNIKNIFKGEPKEEIRNELKELLSVFEEKFIAPEIINENSEVIYNPKFGVSSLLVDGADADIFIDGTLYDFKTSKKNEYNFDDSAQIMGYYLLNELSINLNISLDLPDYDGLEIKRLALYKARFGETEYYDLSNMPITVISNAIQKMSAYFIGKTEKLWSHFINIDELNRCLEVIRDEITLSNTGSENMMEKCIICGTQKPEDDFYMYHHYKMTRYRDEITCVCRHCSDIKYGDKWYPIKGYDQTCDISNLGKVRELRGDRHFYISYTSDIYLSKNGKKMKKKIGPLMKRFVNE